MGQHYHSTYEPRLIIPRQNLRWFKLTKQQNKKADHQHYVAQRIFKYIPHTPYMGHYYRHHNHSETRQHKE